MGDPLRGLRVLNTRPRAQATHLDHLLKQHGAQPVGLPLLSIEAVGDPAELQQTLCKALDFDGWIVTSVNAVERLERLGVRIHPNCFAIGGATARALEAAGCSNPKTPPAGSSSESLLAHPDLLDVNGGRYLLCTGEGGRTLLEETLRQRGAGLDRLELYRRVPTQFTDEEVEQALSGIDAVLLTSAEGLQRLEDLMNPPLRASLHGGLLVVSSPRVLEIAQRLGFENVHAPTHPSDEALVECLIRARDQTAADQEIMTDDAAKPDAPQEDRQKSTQGSATGQVPEAAVTEESHTAAPSQAATLPPTAPVPTSASRGSTVVAVAMGVIILALMAVTGYAGWLLIQERTQLLGRIEAQNDKIAGYDARILANSNGVNDVKNARQETLRRIEGTEAAFSGLQKEFSGLQQQVNDGLTQVARLTEEISGGRTRFELAAVEHLLTLANDRLQISGDVRGALIALEGADARLGRLADPQMFGVRAALSDEIAALRAVQVPDVAAATLSLASLIQNVPTLPLRSEAPQEFESPEARQDTEITTDQGWSRFVESVKTASKQLFTVRRDDDQGVLRLLSPEAETAVYDILTLKLEGARVSMLKGDTDAARTQLRSASGWLSRQFRTEDRAVSAMLEELAKLGTLELEPELPDISTSLTTLRRKLQNQG